MSEQIVQVADSSPSTKNMRTIQQTAGGNTVQSEVIVLATGAANGSDTYDARQIRTLTSMDVVTAILQGVTLGQKTMIGSLPVVIASNQSALPVSGTIAANQGTAGSLANAWPSKITDGTNTLSFYSEADIASSLLGTAIKGPYVQAELVGIWDQPTKQEALTQLAAFKAKYAVRYPEAVRSLAEDEEHLLTFYAFPQTLHRHMQTTNAIESLFSNVRQRTDQIDVFTTETSCLTIVWATIQDIRLHNITLE